MKKMMLTTTTSTVILLGSVLLHCAVGALAIQAGSEARADEDVYLSGTVESTGGHGSFGLLLAGGAGHLTEPNDDGDRVFRFEDPPEVVKVYKDGPAADLLRNGDLVVAIDGLSITSEDAGWMLQHPIEGRTYKVTVRRGNDTHDVRVTAGKRSIERAGENTVEVLTEDEDGTTHVVSYSLNEAGNVTRLSRRSIGGSSDSRSWFGMGIESDVMVVKKTDDGDPYYYFGSPPTVYSVDPAGPADRAGIRRGDELIKIDGLRLDEDPGGERWSVVKAGEGVELLVLRDGKIYALEVEADEHPSTRTQDDERLPADRDPMVGGSGHLRYAGVLGDVDIEVRGRSDVSVTKSAGSIQIRVGDTTVNVSVREQ